MSEVIGAEMRLARQIFFLIVLPSVLALVFWQWLVPRRPSLPNGVTEVAYNRARQSFELQYRKSAEHLDVVSWLAESAVANQRLERAVACFQAIPNEHTKYGHSARLQQAQILLRLKHAAEAEAQLREFLRLEQQDRQRPVHEQAHALGLMRHILEVELRFEERVSILEAIEQADALDPFGLLMLCFPSIPRWNGPAATAWLEEFWQATPQDFDIRVALARSRTSHGRLSEAKELLDACREERPDSLAALAATLAWFHEQDDWKGFAVVAQRLPPRQDGEPWFLLRLRARWALHQRRPADAVSICETLLQRNPTDIEGWELLAESQSQLQYDTELQESRRKVNVLARIQTRIGGIVFHNDDPDYQDQVLKLMHEVAQLAHEAGFHCVTERLAKYLIHRQPDSQQARQLLASTDSDVDQSKRPDSNVRPRLTRPRQSHTKTAHTSAATSGNLSLQFTEVALEAGIHFERFDDIRDLHRIQESTGGGVALLDYDANGLQDLYFSNGCRLPLKSDDQKHPPACYRNVGDGRFELVTAFSGLTWFAYGSGCAVGDFDADGFDDLFVGSYRDTSLWRNNGDGTFHEVSTSAGVVSTAWTSSAAFADVNRDGNLDLYVVTYLQCKDDPPELCSEKAAPDGYTTCPPTLFAAEEDVLFLSTGDGKFIKAPQGSNLSAPDGKGLGVVIFRADEDDWPDIYVANDGTPNFLFLNRTFTGSEISGQAATRLGSTPLIPRFEESATLLGCAVNRYGAAEASMGIACGDYDADGWLDLFCTNYHLETNTLYRNLEGGGFSDETAKSGLGPPSRSQLGFGTQFFDADNDGWLDLIVTNGHIDDLRWQIGDNPYRMKPQLFRNTRNQSFREVTAESGVFFHGEYLGRGLASGDLDNDGDIDIVISHQLGPSAVLRNDTVTEQHSVTLRLIGTGLSNRSAINAIVEAEGLDLKLVREVIGGGSFQSSSDLRVHLGLGSHKMIPRLSVRWPSGRKDEFRDVAAGQWRLIEGRELSSSLNESSE